MYVYGIIVFIYRIQSVRREKFFSGKSKVKCNYIALFVACSVVHFFFHTCMNVRCNVPGSDKHFTEHSLVRFSLKFICRLIVRFFLKFIRRHFRKKNTCDLSITSKIIKIFLGLNWIFNPYINVKRYESRSNNFASLWFILPIKGSIVCVTHCRVI